MRLLFFLIACCLKVRTDAQQEPPSVRTLTVHFNATEEGHRAFGLRIGSFFAADIRTIFADDLELAALVSWTTAGGRGVLQSLSNASRTAFPLYYEEVVGMAAGAGVDFTMMLVNQFREELVQLMPNSTKAERMAGRGLCSTVFVSGDGPQGSRLLGHNDDWTQDWRGNAYFLSGIVTRHATEGSLKGVNGGDPLVTQEEQFGTWVYPGYIAGMDLSWNSHGVVYSVNSLFPVALAEPTGVGSAFVARHLLGATSLDDAVSRASDSRVASSMSYNFGSLTFPYRLLEVEVSNGGVSGRHAVNNGSYFHGNEYICNTSRTAPIPAQFPDASTTARAKRFKELQPILTAESVLGYLGDTQGDWPVWRNHTAPDDCFTEVTGLFDLRAATLSVWTGNPSPPATPSAVFSLKTFSLM